MKRSEISLLMKRLHRPQQNTRPTSPAQAISNSRLSLSLCIGSLLFLNSTLVKAQDESLDEITITGEKLDLYDVLPDRKTGSVYGGDKAMEEIPRAVTLVESELIDLLGIRTVNDFVAITPGSFTGNYFGVPGAIDLRGERADNFFRGFRRIENRGNFPTTIVAADYVELIKGPPPIIYGGGKVGGILNFVPKSAESKTTQLIGDKMGRASLTLGTYNKKVASVEAGMPFNMGSRQSGVYVVGQVEDSEHFYDDIYNKDNILQVAFNTEATDKLHLEYGFMIQDADLNQSLGWNRVTQELIDSEGGRYLAGRPALDLDTNGDNLLSPSEVSAYSLEQFAFANPFPYDALTAEQQAAFALDPDTIEYVSIDHHTVQVEESDFSQSEVFTAYFDLIYGDLEADGWQLKNQSFYDTMDHLKHSSYGFTADYEAYVFENKTTLTMEFEPSDALELTTIYGLSFRQSSGEEKESRGRGFQVLDRRDISYGATGNDRFEGAHTGTGNVPYNWVQDGEFTDTGLFALVDMDFVDRYNLIIGARYDNYDATTDGTDLNAVMEEASDDEGAFSYNVSFSTKITDNINVYATRAVSDYIEIGQGGMIARQNIENGIWVQESELSEVGFKGFFFDKKLYVTATYYNQDKTAFDNVAQTFDTYESKGFEFDARVAATETLSFTASYTNQETIIKTPPFFLGVPPEALGLDPELTYGGRFVGVGSMIGFDGPLTVPSPEQVASINGVYTSKMGWGFSLGATYVDSMYAGYSQTITLPSYTVARGALFYEHGNFDVRLNANNLFDEKYYTPQFLFWDVFISPSIGPTAELSLTYKW